MPAYVSSPFGPSPNLLLPGQPGYSLGTFSDRLGTTKLYISATEESAGNVIKAYCQVWAGPVPVAGQYVSTQGLANVPNVTNIPIASVSFDANGLGYITYADASDQGSTVKATDAGLGLVPPVVTLEAAASTGTAKKGLAFALPPMQFGNTRSIAWGNTVNNNGATVSAVSFVLQGAIDNVDAEYYALDASTTAGETRTYTPISQVNFVRIVATLSFTVATPKVAAEISI